MASLLIALHVAAVVVWIGSILSVAVVCTSSTGDTKLRGQLATELYKKLAVPAFLIAFLAGAARLVSDLGGYFVATKFMHPKLTLALVVIALHHVIGARAKRMATEQTKDAGNALTLAVALLACAVAASFFAVLKPF